MLLYPEGAGVNHTRGPPQPIHRSAWKGNSANFALRPVRWHHACARRSRPAREASREEGGASMDFNEKVLYHQIHPAKLAADVSGSLLSTYLMWRRRFAWAMLAAFVPAVLASVLVIRYADLQRRKHSRFGRYMRRYMDRRV